MRVRRATRGSTGRVRSWSWGIVVALIVLLVTPPSQACVYSKMVASLNRAIQAYLKNPNATNLNRICNKLRRFENKFTGAPGKPVPAIPAGVMCGAGSGGGGGRGGGPGGGIAAGPQGPPGGPGLGSIVFVRNHHPFDCIFDWGITPDPNNPAGFTVSPLMGSTLVPARSTATVPLTVTIGGAVSPGEVAFYDVEIFDTCNMAPLPPDLARFSVTANPEISVEPIMPLVLASHGVPFMVSWCVTNHSGGAISKPFALVPVGDPASVHELNNGMPYPVLNVFDTSGSGGGMVNLNPGESTQIDWGPLALGEFCDPEMTNCCGLEIDGALTCVVIANDGQGPDNPDDSFFNLEGVAQGGFVQIDLLRPPDQFFVQVPTSPGQPIPDILDQIAQNMLQQAFLTPGFHFMPVVDEDGIGILNSPTTQVNFQSFDAGLNWSPHDFFAGNAGGDILFINGDAGGTDRVVDVGIGQSITVDLNATLAGPATGPYWMYVWPGLPQGPPEVFNAGNHFIGLVAGPTPFNPGANPQPLFCLRGGVPPIVCGPVREKPAPPEFPFSVTKPGGIGNGLELMLQALVLSNGSNSTTGFSVSNAAGLRVQ